MCSTEPTPLALLAYTFHLDFFIGSFSLVNAFSLVHFLAFASLSLLAVLGSVWESSKCKSPLTLFPVRPFWAGCVSLGILLWLILAAGCEV